MCADYATVNGNWAASPSTNATSAPTSESPPTDAASPFPAATTPRSASWSSSRPGSLQQKLAVVEVAAANRTSRERGQPGVRLRCYLDLRQEPGP
ncbi:DUF6207 family protein [Streptomyces sp. NPDC051051]|uniref:DUF6207 family protein n=1 Tax=Streptomyces sp. NPDC051051 TaxID=3155666 RepID=UPI0034168CF1